MRINSLSVTDSKDELFESLRELLTEGEFQSRWILVQTYHEVGRLLLGHGGNITELVKQVSVKLGKSDRILWHAVKFYKKYPDLNSYPSGKNISWKKIVREELTTPKEVEAHEHTPILICSSCKIKL